MMDPDFAKLLRIPTLLIATLLMVLGLIVMGLGPPSPESDWGYAALRLSAIALALVLMWVAGWLRSQEALDPTNNGRVSRSILRHFILYLLISVAISWVIAGVVAH